MQPGIQRRALVQYAFRTTKTRCDNNNIRAYELGDQNMLKMKRRDILVGSGAAATAILTSGSANSLDGASASAPVLTVYTDDIPSARDLALSTLQSANSIAALKGDLVQLWKEHIGKHRGAIQGYTSWSDYILMRGLGEEQGLRLRAEAQLRHNGNKPVFRWVMA